jgi:hypothetical protein
MSAPEQLFRGAFLLLMRISAMLHIVERDKNHHA